MKGIGINIMWVVGLLVSATVALGQPTLDLNIHENRLIPGERAGILMLGSTLEEIIAKLGGLKPFRGQGVGVWPFKVFYKGSEVGGVENWFHHSVPAMGGFCKGEQPDKAKMFFAGFSLLRDSAFDAGRQNLRTLNARFPEDLGLPSGEDRIRNVFGDPDPTERPKGLGGPVATLLLFPNGAALNGDVQNKLYVGIAVYDFEICRTGTVAKGEYFAFLGKKPVKQIALSKTCEPAKGEFGEPTTVFGKDEEVCVLMEFDYLPTKIDRPLGFVRRLKKDGAVVWEIAPTERVLKPGGQPHRWVFRIGKTSKGGPGKYTYELVLNRTQQVVASISYEVTE